MNVQVLTIGGNTKGVDRLKGTALRPAFLNLGGTLELKFSMARPLPTLIKPGVL